MTKKLDRVLDKTFEIVSLIGKSARDGLVVTGSLAIIDGSDGNFYGASVGFGIVAFLGSFFYRMDKYKK